MKQATDLEIATALKWFRHEEIAYNLNTKTGVRDAARMIGAFLSHRESYSVRYIEGRLFEGQGH